MRRLYRAGRFADDQLRRELTMYGQGFAFLDCGVDAFHNDAYCGTPEGLHRLAHGGERRDRETGGYDVVEADHRAVFGDSQPGTGQTANRPEGRHVVERHQGRELLLVLQKLVGEAQAVLVSGIWIERARKVRNERSEE